MHTTDFLNRSSDPSGKTYWKTKIADTDNDILILFIGFSDSDELAEKCSSYGIIAGDSLAVPATARLCTMQQCWMVHLRKSYH